MHELNRRVAAKPLALGMAAAMAITGAFSFGAAAPAQAAPLSTNAASLQHAAGSDVIDVRHRRGARAAAAILGIAGVALLAYELNRRERRAYRQHYQPYYGKHYSRKHYGRKHYRAYRGSSRCVPDHHNPSFVVCR